MAEYIDPSEMTDSKLKIYASDMEMLKTFWENQLSNAIDLLSEAKKRADHADLALAPIRTEQQDREFAKLHEEAVNAE